MKAAMCRRYGGPEVLSVTEVPVPEPQQHELLVHVHSASVTRADCMMRQGAPKYARLFLGWRRPKQPIPGTGFAGVVQAIGAKVTRFRPGDRVFGETGVRFSSNAECLCVAEDGVLLPIPAGMPFEEAAPLCDGALTAWNFLMELGRLQRGQHVLVNGASGSLGSAGVQLARSAGARVTGICGSSNVDWVRSLGADRVIDYTREDFTRNGQAYDLIFDAVGTNSFRRSRNALKQNGSYLSPVLRLPLLWQMAWTAVVGRQRARFTATGLRPPAELRAMLEQVVQQYSEGRLNIRIDRRYGLENIVDAHRYVEAGHKRGNVVLIMNGAGGASK